ncbi:MAG: hypothetical protein HBSAPP03_22780 [Phycisphaerae bacterium]|nr:MAG: hypothetical protein HBSAPP03_22780 [Phycisphaerae bacterium]
MLPGRRRGWGFLIFVFLLLVGYTAIARRNTMPEVFAQALTLDQAEARSRDTGMPVLVFATADWCSPCAEFKRGALRHREVQQWIRENTIPVLVEMNDRNASPPEAERLKVWSLPTMLVLRDGKETARLDKVVPKDALLAWLAESTGALADWKHANPGQELPDLHTGTKRLPEAPGSIKVVPGAATPGGS